MRAERLKTLFPLAILTMAILTVAPRANADIGDPVVAQSCDATAQVGPPGGDFTADVYYEAPSGRVLLGTTHAANGPVDLSGFETGDEMVFSIYVRDTGQTYYTGPASRNPDGIEHANVTVSEHVVTIGFEDLPGGGDLDYDDVTLTLTFTDTTPPTISGVSVDKSVLWPPNHQMVDVAVNYTASDCDPNPTTTLTVTSNEPDNGLGDGDTAGDIDVVDNHHVRLRAERSGKGAGRVYTITITATDSFGNSSTSTVTVSVPHDKK